MLHDATWFLILGDRVDALEGSFVLSFPFITLCMEAFSGLQG